MAQDAQGYAERNHIKNEQNFAATWGFDAILLILEYPRFLIPFLSIFVGFHSSWLFYGGGIISTIVLSVLTPVIALGSFAAYVWIGSLFADGGSADLSEVLDFTDKAFEREWAGKMIPMEVVNEAYMNRKVDFKGDWLKIMWKRHNWFRMCITTGHIKFFFNKFVGQLINHSQSHDTQEVRDVYERGNDFYSWFLGPTMTYTSGIYHDPSETLEVAQTRKMDLVCKKGKMKPGMEHLDIGCGWGTLISHAAKNYGTNSTGVTLSRPQRDWGLQTAETEGVKDRVNILCMDYRDIPKKQYDVITCLEMAEHVGIKNFQPFLIQVKDMLKDDGIMYFQIAGLRRCWQYEDLIWGLFMGTYIFPAADASCPMAFTVSQMERAGWEVHSVENCGVHYSLTINQWYVNWLENEDKVIAKYGHWWFRLWVVFLGWSTIIASQGSSTVFCMAVHKNTSRFERRKNFVDGFQALDTQG